VAGKVSPKPRRDLVDPRAPRIAPPREPLAQVLGGPLIALRLDLLGGFRGLEAERAPLTAEQIPRFRFLFVEESAVLGRFQFGGFDCAAGFKLRGETGAGETFRREALGFGVVVFVAEEA